MNAGDVRKELLKFSSEDRAKKNAYFFKTGLGQYSEGEIFVGVRTPEIRLVAKEFIDLSLSEVGKLFESEVHEERLTAAILLTFKYHKYPEQREATYSFYLDLLINGTTSQTPEDFSLKGGRSGIDNWDIVDVSAHKIVGRHLASTMGSKDREILYQLAASSELWQNRVAIVATWWLITKELHFIETLKLSKIYMDHPHDLIHKASGWMLREVGKKDLATLTNFLDANSAQMPRTMLRYSIELLPKEARQKYLSLGAGKTLPPH